MDASVMTPTENVFNQAGALSSSNFIFIDISPSSSTTNIQSSLEHSTRSKTSWFIILAALALIVVVCFFTLNIDLWEKKKYVLFDTKKYQTPPKDIPNATTSLHQINQTTIVEIVIQSAAPSIEVELPNNTTPIPMDLSIPEKTPTKTINVEDFPKSATGRATIDMFKGQWIPRNDTALSSPINDNPTCPLLASLSMKFFCNYTKSSRKRQHKEYHVAQSHNLDPFNASLFVERTKELGPVMIVGDSVALQMKDSLVCLLESQLGLPFYESLESVVLFSYTAIPMNGELMEDVEVKSGVFPETRDEYERMIDLSWAETAIEKNVSYVVFNTGAWWNNDKFRIRGPWCDYGSWREVSDAEMVTMYERSFRRTVIPILQRLRAEHGIITIWRDVSSAGMWSDKKKTIVTRTEKFVYYHLFPVFNRIGRRLVTELADGLILPIFDLSLDRWDDHVLSDASYASTDLMHWCINYNNDDVPAVWNRLLYQVLFGSVDENVNNTALDSGESSTTMKVGSQLQRQQPNTTANNMDSRMGEPPFTIESSESVLLPIDANLEVDDLLLRVPYSRSNTSECQCGSARTFYHCVANIACRWVEIPHYGYNCSE